MKKSKLIFGICAITIKILYDFQITHFLPKVYMHSLSYGINFDRNKLIVGYLTFFILMLCFIKYQSNKNNTMTQCLTILFGLYYIPLNSSFYLNSLSYGYFVSTNLYCIFFVLLASIGIKKNSSQSLDTINKKIYQMRLKDRIICTFSYIIDISCIIYTYFYNGFSITLNITDIYDVRNAFVGSTNLLTSFLFNFGGSVFIVISIYYAVKTKKYILLCLGVLAQLGIFSIARQKTHLLVFFILFGVYFLKKLKLLKKIKIIFMISLTVLNVMSIIEFYIFNKSKLFTMLIRRMMYYPSWLNSIYYDYFSKHKLLLLTQDVFLIRKIGFNRYRESVLSIINNMYFDGLVSSPNSGLFSEAFMHFGYFGVIIFPIIDIILLKLLFKYIKYYDEAVQILLVIKISISLSNIGITSSIFCISYIVLIPITFILIKIQRYKYINFRF